MAVNGFTILYFALHCFTMFYYVLLIFTALYFSKMGTGEYIGWINLYKMETSENIGWIDLYKIGNWWKLVAIDWSWHVKKNYL